MVSSATASSERTSPPPTEQNHPPRLLDKVKTVAAHLLATLGLVIFLAATFALGGHLFGYMAIPSDTVQMLFTASIMSIVSGFHLAKDARLASIEFAAGPLSFGIGG